MSNRKICIVTGTRAEYGLLFWLMKEINADTALDLQIAVTGTHLAPQFGETVRVIEGDGFLIDERIDIEVGDDTPVGVARSLGLGVIGMGEAFDRLRPDIIIVLGDRYEVFAAAAAMLARIPIGHIHGGEITEGATDDAMRHAITKMSALHYVAAEEYRARVIQLGETPESVFTVGAPGIDNIVNLNLMGRGDLEKELGLQQNQNFFLATYQPATLGPDDPGMEVGEMLAAIDNYSDFGVIITGVNADTGHETVTRKLSEYVTANKGRASLHASLGQVRYLSDMKYSAVVIGNSSSGIIEAPAIKTPTVNIGDRQKGRLRASSIIDCAVRGEDIAAAIGQALDSDFRAAFETMTLPYGGGGASTRIKDQIKAANLTSLVRKSFYDIGFQKAAS